MATQLATTETRAPAKVAVTAGNKLSAFVPQSLEEAWRLSGAIAASGMTPKTYGADQNKVMVGILAGAELGLTPFAALQSIAVINGTPSLWGDGMLGLVEASGLLDDFEESDDGKTATCRAVRKGRPTPVIRSFSVEDAKAAGLSSKQGPWQQYPKRMRQLRARSFALRDAFSDVLKGVKSAEEVRDYAPMGGGQMLSAKEPVTANALLGNAPAEEGVDAATGEVLTGRTDEQHGDQHTDDGDDPLDPLDPRPKLVVDLLNDLSIAATAADIKAADTLYLKHRAAMDDEYVADIDAALAAARARIGGAK